MVTQEQTDDFERLMRELNPTGAQLEELITLMNAIFSDNADNVTVLGGSEVRVVAADFDINNTETLADVTGLETSSLAVGTKYYVEVLLLVESATTTPDLDIKFIGSANSLMNWDLGASVDGAVIAKTIASEIEIALDNLVSSVSISGILNVVDTAGTLKLQAAQGTATVEDTTIKAGSMIRVTRVE